MIAIAAVIAGLGVGALLVLSGSGDDAVDCDRFVFDRAEWHAARTSSGNDYERLSPLARGLHQCDLLKGQHAAQVRALLGRPSWVFREPQLSLAWSLGEHDTSDPETLSVLLGPQDTVVATTLSDES